MIARKKVEIIVESLHVNTILNLVNKLQLGGYSMIKNVMGSGEHGEIDADDLSGSFNNSYILIICPEEKMEAFITQIRPKLKKIGAIALISDVMWVQH